MFKAVVSTLSLLLVLAIATVVVSGQEVQTPSMKIQVDVGIDLDPETAFPIQCDVIHVGNPADTPQEDEDAATFDHDIIPVAVLSDVTQSTSFDITNLILVPAGSATLSQTPSDEFGRTAAHYGVELAAEDLNGDGLADVVFYFQKADLFDSAEACSGASELMFDLEVFTGSGYLALSGSDSIEPQFTESDEELPATPAEPAGVGLSFNRAYVMSHGSHAYQFVAHGTGIQDMQVQIYGLGGNRVFDSGFVASNTLNWHGLNDNGTVVANGVYLYVVTVRGFNGEIVRSEVNKLVILR